MTTPTATYRLQFRNDMTFARAAALVPYLRDLGVSHLYASPIFSATPGSTHGYDVINHNQFDPELGGETGFRLLADALRSAGLGLVLDIVPNHMGADPANPWWRSVLEWGQASPFARHFDINWREKLTLPVLGKPLDACLEDGSLVFGIDESGFLGLSTGGAPIPISPPTYGDVLDSLDHEAAGAIAELARQAVPGAGEETHARILALLGEDGVASLQDALTRHSADRERVRRVHSAQAWQLIFWRDARRHLSYRRFFEVTGLAGVRVEDEQVFDDVHRLTLQLVREGTVDGLRVDHVDGLANPRSYLERLREVAGEETWVVVEKILEAEETLPPDWPIAGTTGYEFIAALAGVLTDADKAEELDQAYAAAVEPDAGFAEERRRAKLEILRHNLETELAGLQRLAEEAAAADGSALPATALREAIVELIVALPVYRFYGEEDGLRESDLQLLQSVMKSVQAAAPETSATALDFVVRLLKQEVGPEAVGPAREFRRRLQQTSGPVMAKAIEDTLFYRRNRLLALNEVGGDPENRDGSVETFHRRMAARVEGQPEGLLTTATHDTKRGEDARARLYAISEAPGSWAESVERWRATQRPAGGPAPEPETEWMIYQALAGVWPLDLDAGDDALESLRHRFATYLEKAMREAKSFTSWTDVDEAYEGAVQSYAANLLSAENQGFRTDFSRTIQNFCRAGALNSLAQVTLKLTAPGIPDIYQGCESWDFSLVDPDNRRPVDFGALATGLSDLEEPDIDVLLTDWRSGRIKQFLVHEGLRLRSRQHRLFTHGAYRPLDVRGSRARHVIAFMRSEGSNWAIVTVPRLTLPLLDEGEGVTIPSETWGDTAVAVPEEVLGRPCRDAFTDGAFRPGATLPVAELFARCPVSLLVSGK